MIVGVGVDLCDVTRFEAVARRWGDRLYLRLFSDEERRAGRRRRGVERLAARFAAKEAARKALGAQDAGRWRDIEVVSDDLTGAPSLLLHGRAKEKADSLGVQRCHVSLTHQAGMAAAVVVLEA